MNVQTRGKKGVETTFLVDCQQGINRDIEQNEQSIQLQHVLQNIDNKSIATILATFQKKEASNSQNPSSQQCQKGFWHSGEIVGSGRVHKIRLLFHLQ